MDWISVVMLADLRINLDLEGMKGNQSIVVLL